MSAEDFHTLLTRYTEHLARENYAPATIESYTGALERFGVYLSRKGISSPVEVERAEIEAYHSELRSELAAGSVLCILKVLRSFFRFLEAEEHIFASPFSGRRKRLSAPRNAPDNVLTGEEVTRLFGMPDLRTPKGYRDRVALELLYCTGIRKSEAVHLNVADIDLRGGVLYVRQGKGSKDRVVPLAAGVSSLLEEYLEKVRPVMLCMDLKEEALFVSRFGTRFSRNTLTRIIREYARAAEIQKKVTTHTFRHTFAAHMIRGGARVRYVQEILGHEKLSTTRIYTKVYVADLKKAVKMYHPRENDLFESGTLPLPSRRTAAGKVMLPRVFTAGKSSENLGKKQLFSEDKTC
jgi:integrase/recombinase XerD